MTEIAQNSSGAGSGIRDRGGNRDEANWFQTIELGSAELAAERLRRAGAGDGAMSGLERWSADGAMPGGLQRRMDLSDVRLEEVVRLRVAIASGCYRVSAADLADKIIASVAGTAILDGRKYD